MVFLSKKDTPKLQDLSDGKEIIISVNDELNYDPLSNHNISDMWSLLLHTGYLTAVEDPGDGDYKVKIPNPENKKCFDKSIMASFNDAVTLDNKNLDILRALSDGDNLQARKLIGSLLVSYISIRVCSGKSRPENFYGGFMSGILASLSGTINALKVGQEAGEGYADLKLSYDNYMSGMVIELKVSKDPNHMDIETGRAIEQIKRKGYASSFITRTSVYKVSAVAIVFSGKSCFVMNKRLK